MKLPDEADYRYTRTLLAEVHFWRNLACLLPYAVKMPRVYVPRQRRESPDLVPTPRLTPRPRYHL